MRPNDGARVICILLLSIVIVSLLAQVEAITWSSSKKQLTNYAFHDGYPALTQTDDGKLWVVWSREIAGNLTLYYKTTSNLGKSWSNEMNLTNVLSPGQNQNPSIIQAENGTIWLTWTSDRPPLPAPPLPDFYLEASPQNLVIPQGETDNSTIMVTSLHDFNDAVDLTIINQPAGVTATLDPAQVVPPANTAANSTLAISVSSDATPGNYVLTVTGRSGHAIRTVDVYLEITVAAGASQATTPPNGLSLSTMQTPSSTGDYEIYYKTSHDNGATWSKDTQLTSNNVDDMFPTILQLNNGTIIIIWQTYVSESYNIVYKTTTDGTSWSSITQLTTESTDDMGPTATQTTDGKLWVAWVSRRTGDYEIFYKTYDGLSWSTDTRLTYNTDSDINPAMIQAVNGDILIFWASGSDTDSYDLYYKYSSDDGTSWSETITFVTNNYEKTWPATTRTRDTKIWVVWMSNEVDENYEIFCRTSLAGDVNEDNTTNVLDLTLVSLSFGTFEGEPEYSPDADINKDGIVDIRDLTIVAYYLGET